MSDKTTFEEAVRIVYYMFCRDNRTYMIMMEELLSSGEDFDKTIAPAWKEQYKQHLADNKKQK